MIKLSFPFTEEKIRVLKAGGELFNFRRRVDWARCAGFASVCH
jgi:hypothetical protein